MPSCRRRNIGNWSEYRRVSQENIFRKLVSVGFVKKVSEFGYVSFVVNRQRRLRINKLKKSNFHMVKPAIII
jgi:hypothetical protein